MMIGLFNDVAPIIRIKIAKDSCKSPFFRKGDTNLIRMAVSNVVYETCLQDRDLLVDTSEIDDDTIKVFMKNNVENVTMQKIDSLSKEIHEKIRNNVFVETRIITK